MKSNLDIFDVLNKIHSKDIAYFEGLDKDTLKKISPLVLMRWMSGVKCQNQIILLNEIVNPMIFNLQHHQMLLLYLLATCSTGANRSKWIKVSNKKKDSYPNSLEVVMSYYGYSKLKAIDTLPIIPNDVILELAYDLGYQEDDIKKLKKELKDR